MHASAVVTTLFSILALSSASPLTTPPAKGPQPTCTTTMTYEETFVIQVMLGATVTSTSSVDCKGCALTLVGNDQAPEQTPAPELPSYGRKNRRQVENDPNTQTLTVWETTCATSA
ncbi:Adseverin [Sphaceloma murrayae]|uniref:Adseverin n=1 Tax=Sphaceloma murrayae TaxID=2082308 RepID=A0A2K1QYE6_9PEZI|nr:Adseverin [Sphaceloma murrayae]